MKTNLSKNIQELEITPDILQKLKNNHISTIQDLIHSNRKTLKEKGLSDPEIKHIIIKLQLQGFDLNHK